MVDIGAFNTIMSKLPVFALCRDYRPHPFLVHLPKKNELDKNHKHSQQSSLIVMK